MGINCIAVQADMFPVTLLSNVDFSTVGLDYLACKQKSELWSKIILEWSYCQS